MKTGILESYADVNEVEDASRRSRHDISQDENVQSLKEGKVEGKNSIEDANEHGNEGGSFLHPRCRTKLTLSLGRLAKPDSASTEGDKHTAVARELIAKNDTLFDAQDGIRWHERQIEYLEKGHGIPEDPYAKPNPPPAPATIDGETDDAAIARLVWEEELAEWRGDRIQLHEAKVSMRQEKIASLSAGLGDIAGAENGEADSGSSQAPLGGDSVSPLQADPQPGAISRTKKRNIERKRVLERKRAKGKEAEEAAES